MSEPVCNCSNSYLQLIEPLISVAANGVIGGLLYILFKKISRLTAINRERAIEEPQRSLEMMTV